MPKSKRNKQIELSKTKKRGLEWKKKLFGEIRSCVDSYNNVFVFSVNDMRNSKMKTVRDQWKDSRFFIGKNKIMAMALGRFAEEEYKPNLHKIGKRIKGQRALLFSSRSTEDVLSWFRSYSEGVFARSGNKATEDVRLPAGPLPQFPHSLEPYLRQLGLPTSLVKGVIHLVKDHEVCKLGDVLTPETAKILEFLGYEMAEFHITIDCVWSKDGSFMQLTKETDLDTKENKKKKGNSLTNDKHSSPAKEDTKIDEMEIEDNDEDDEMSDSSAPELQADVPSIAKAADKVEISNLTYSDAEEDICDINKAAVDEDMSDTDVPEPKAAVEEDKSSDSSVPKLQNSICNASEAADEDKIDISPVKEIVDINSNVPNNINSKSPVQKINVDEEEVELSLETPAKKKKVKNNSIDVDKEIINSMKNCSTPIDTTSTLVQNENADDDIIKEANSVELSTETPISKNNKVKKQKNVSSVNEEEESNNRPSRPRQRPVTSKKVSLPVTPDIANSSQDSPIFRELRNRSVKVNRKRNKRI